MVILRLVAVLLLVLVASSSYAADAIGTRTFEFTYSAAIGPLQSRQQAHVWVPIPQDNDQQSVKLLSSSLPGAASRGREAKYGNAMLSFVANGDSTGMIPLRFTYLITRCAAGEMPDATPAREDEPAWLQADALVPIGGKPQSLVGGRSLPQDSMQRARSLYDLVDAHMQYRKDRPGWGRGDAAWACESGFGNCTDFHSLFISLARTDHIPCRFEIGFSIPIEAAGGKVPGYHCWTWCKPSGHGWLPVDISEANRHPRKRDFFFGHLDADRILFSTGRDLILEPKQGGPPLNFFVFPYAEIDGKPLYTDMITMNCTYEEVKTRATSAAPSH